MLNRSQYQKLLKVLSYKLAVVGLPRPLEVHPGYTSQACPVCGHIATENRKKIASADGFETHKFVCAACGFSDNADLNAARKIALKRIWRDGLFPALRSTPLKNVPEGEDFSTFLRVHAERRGERPCGRMAGTSGGAGLDAQYEGGEVAPGGNAVEPRSGPKTPAGENSSIMPSAVSPSDEIPHTPLTKPEGFPDG